MSALDVSEGDGNVTLEIKKTETVDFDFDVIVIPVPSTAGESQLMCVRTLSTICMYD